MTQKAGSSASETTIEPANNGRKVTWGYSRKRAWLNHEGAHQAEEVSLYVTESVPDDADLEMWVADNTGSVLNNMKTEVWGALGFSYGWSEGGEPVLDMEIPAPLQPHPEAVEVQPRPTAPLRPYEGAPPPPTTTTPLETAVHNLGDAVAPGLELVGRYAAEPKFCGEVGKGGCGNTTFFDNRATQDEKITRGEKCGPDWTCTKCKKGVFRSGSYDYNQGIGSSTSMLPPAF